MNDEQLLRYSRHILLDEWGIEAQEKVSAAHALIIGVGGLGTPAAMYLAAAGVGRLTLVDGDTVDLTNLQRQIAHTTETVGMPKTASARLTLARLNPTIVVETVAQRADDALLDRLVPTADVVLDCCDNFDTRHAVNRACVRAAVPLVSGAALRFDGQLSAFDTRNPASPCYACLFPPDHAPAETACATMGVFAPAVGVIGTMQAADALRIISGIGRTMVGRLLMHDALETRWNELAIDRDPACPVCATRGSGQRG
ncbi:HesA/MoeB/ThiF family protein [Chitinasiproducens palmae]|uniref:Molybdopterin or thiamine biosynthesis adenylyltransferase n=1 Tax=Chitinasiproducens palmae TaxID=1770053 RepID=A0A1H2PNM5_9BURK|nr:molybdopterin-synthase adenylyltransferase MoeB [Chitinasiproducens palmae]SDV48254.1 Molybdopterin or thiamine biosynthesis adenylyltransferase [Chitinasiproducens palmae]